MLIKCKSSSYPFQNSFDILRVGVEKRFHLCGHEMGKRFQQVLVGKVDFECYGMMIFCLSDKGRLSDVEFSFHPSVGIDILFWERSMSGSFKAGCSRNGILLCRWDKGSTFE